MRMILREKFVEVIKKEPRGRYAVLLAPLKLIYDPSIISIPPTRVSVSGYSLQKTRPISVENTMFAFV